MCSLIPVRRPNAAVMLGLLHPGDKIMGFDLSHGGHLHHGSPVNFSGKLYQPVFYGVEKETGLINYDKVDALAKKEKPKLIICETSACPAIGIMPVCGKSPIKWALSSSGIFLIPPD